MLKCKIKSIRPIGKQMAYNVTMKGNQHNYKVVDANNGVYTRNSHAASYAFLAYQTAFLKTYFFLEYMCNLLSNEIGGDEDKLKAYMRQVERSHYRFQNPNVNKSGMDFSIELIKASGLDATRLEKTLRKPLTILKGVGAKAVQSIIANRPYKNLKDFLTKVDGSKVNCAVFKTLVNAGCFPEEWKESHASLLKQYEIMRKEIAGEKKARKKQEEDTQKYGGGSLFDDC